MALETPVLTHYMVAGYRSRLVEEFRRKLITLFLKKPVQVQPDINFTGKWRLYFDPSGVRVKTAADIAICPNINLIQEPLNPGPPPGDANDNSHARIIVELAAMLWTRQVPAPVGSTPSTNPRLAGWDFGTVQFNSNLATGCNRPGLGNFAVTIPVSDVFWDPPIAAAPNLAKYTVTVPSTVKAQNFAIGFV
ncbi:hypothetical protein RhiirC2_852713 [Rhizophagus irregularis]|uniref:Uncharacterized protein n=1 Tax=Rhizophagus irregularis TaxID=588596 RepID=A0A2N1MYF4_9GLOM|nr:hypothetical protein RhiirC2_852713 [Rhizophagus irregularis]